MNIINLAKATDLERYDEKPNYNGSVLRIAKQFGAKNLGFHLEVMDPKTFSAPYHYHTGEEEMFLVLEGEAIVRCQNQYRKVGPGDLIFYKTGPETPHNMYNHTDKPFKFLAISNAGVPDECYYPDSHKHTSPEGIMQNGVKVDYFKDEEDPARYWPDHALKGEV